MLADVRDTEMEETTLRIRTLLTTAVLAGAIATGTIAIPAHAAEQAPATAVPTQQVLAGWHYDSWYWFHARCEYYGYEKFGQHGIRYECRDLGAGRWGLYYYA